MKHWLKVFPRENFLFVDGEKLLDNPFSEINKTQKFLSLFPEIKEEHFAINNATGYFCVSKDLSRNRTWPKTINQPQKKTGLIKKGPTNGKLKDEVDKIFQLHPNANKLFVYQMIRVG